MSSFGINDARQFTDCHSCTNKGFWWNPNENSCSPFQNNISSFNSSMIDSGSVSCPLTTYPPIIKTSVQNSILDEIVDSNTENQTLQLLQDISVLQTMEKDYYTQLSQGIANNTLTGEQEAMVMEKITELSAIRISLYKQLNTLYELYKNNAASTSQTVREQLIAINIVEEELKNSASKLQKLNDENNSKMRMIEINKYYSDKYKDHTGFMKYFIFFTVITLIVVVLYKKYYISKNVYLLLISIIVWYVIVKMGLYYYNMTFRNNMDYQEYTFPASDLYNNLTGQSTQVSASLNDPWINNELNAISSCANNVINASTTTSSTASTTTPATTTATATSSPFTTSFTL